MDKKTETSLDNIVKDLQLQIFLPRCSAYGLKPEEDLPIISAYSLAISSINKYFKTNYLEAGDILNIKLTDENNMLIEGILSKLPLKKE